MLNIICLSKLSPDAFVDEMTEIISKMNLTLLERDVQFLGVSLNDTLLKFKSVKEGAHTLHDTLYEVDVFFALRNQPLFFGITEGESRSLIVQTFKEYLNRRDEIIYRINYLYRLMEKEAISGDGDR
jgi:hypothetical protein